jgi:hypothetical protein
MRMFLNRNTQLLVIFFWLYNHRLLLNVHDINAHNFENPTEYRVQSHKVYLHYRDLPSLFSMMSLTRRCISEYL